MQQQAATIEMPNPAYEPGHPDSVRFVKLERALRNDPLGQMHARGQLTEYRYAAGRHWQETYEDAGIGRIRSVDTTQEPVDGSRRPVSGITDRSKRAALKRAKWKLALGAHGFNLLECVLVEKMELREAARHLYHNAERPTLTYVGHRFRECLDVIAADMGLIARRA